MLETPQKTPQNATIEAKRHKNATRNATSYRVIQKLKGATLYARPSGKGRVSYSITLYKEGKRVRKALFAANEGDAQAKRRAIEAFKQVVAEFDKGIVNESTIAASSTNFFDFFEQIIATKRPNTAKAWRTALYHLKRWYGDKPLPLKEITRPLCFSLRSHLEQCVMKGSLKASSANVVLAKFKCALNMLHDSGMITVNHAHALKAFSEEKPVISFLTTAELNRLLAAPPPKIRGYCSHEIATFLAFVATTGIRPVDARRLLWRQISESELGCYIDFVVSKTRGKGVSQHRVYLHPHLVCLLKAHKERQTEFSPDGKIFPHLPSERAHTLTLFLRKWAQAANIVKERLHVYSLRHTCATVLLENGNDIYTVANVLGHTSTQHTSRYAHLLDVQRAHAVMRLALNPTAE
jgi:integrase/recombinase XerD